MAVSWRKLKTEYVSGTDSYRVLAERHGISLSTLSKVAKKEGWAQARRQFGDKVDTKTVEAMCARASAREVDRLEGLQRAATRMSEELERVLSDPQQFYRHIVSESRHTTTQDKTESRSGATVKIYKKADIRAMKDFTSALATLTGTMRDLYNLHEDDKDKEAQAGVLMMPDPVPLEDPPEEEAEAQQGTEPPMKGATEDGKPS